MDSQPILFLCGFDSRERAALVLYLNRHLPGCRLDEQQAQLVLVNLDASDGEALWRQHTHGGARPSIVVSLQERHLGNALWLPRPLRLVELLAHIQRRKFQHHPHAQERNEIEAFRRTFQHRRQQPDTAGQNGTNQDELIRDDFFYRPRDYFQGVLQDALEKAKASAQPLRLQSADCGLPIDLTVLPGGEQVFTDNMEALLNRLRFLRARQLPAIHIRPAQLPELNQHGRQDPRIEDAEGVLWRLTLWTSHGRVPLGTDLHAPVRLTHWPNLTRLPHSQEAMRMLALWHNRSLGLSETARRLELPYHQVFSVYSACQAIGLTISEAQASAARATSEVTDRPREASLPSRLLGSLLGKLRKFSKTSPAHSATQ